MRRRTRLFLRPLENRITPSSSSFAGGTLTVSFTEAATQLNIHANVGAIELIGPSFSGAGAGPFFNVSRIVVSDPGSADFQHVRIFGTSLSLPSGLFIDNGSIESIEIDNAIHSGSAPIALRGRYSVDVDASLTSTGSGITLQGNLSSVSTSSRNGVSIAGAATVNSGPGTLMVQGNGGNYEGFDVHGVFVAGKLTSTGGAISVTGAGGGKLFSGNNAGVYVGFGGSIIGGGTLFGQGNVTVSGTGGSGTQAGHPGVRVDGANSRITSTVGNVSVFGTGGSLGASNSAQGVLVANSGFIQAGNLAGLTTVSGTGKNSSHGVAVESGGQLRTGSQGLTVTADGGDHYELSLATPQALLGISGAPITVNADSMILSTAGGTVISGASITTLRNRTAGTLIDLGGPDNNSDVLSLSDAELDRVSTSTLRIGRNDATASGTITLSAPISPGGTSTVSLRTGGDVTFTTDPFSMIGGSFDEANLAIQAAGSISLSHSTQNVDTVAAVSDTGNVHMYDLNHVYVGTVDGVSGLKATAGFVDLRSEGFLYNQQASSAGGNLILHANLAGNSSGSFDGLHIDAPVSAVGAIELKARSGDSSGGGQYGVYIQKNVTTTGGNILINGTSRGSGGGSNYGVVIANGALVQAGGSGTVTVNATAAKTTGDSNYGLYLINPNTLVTSSGGDVTLTGTGGGSGVSDANFGVSLSGGAVVSAGGTGKVTVTGFGGTAAADDNYGIDLRNDDTLITSSGGDVIVAGTGGGTGKTNIGVHVRIGADVTAGGMGKVSVTGTGATGSNGNDNHGVLVQTAGSNIKSSGGPVTVTGTGSGSGAGQTNIGVFLANSGVITAGGTGTVTVTGIGGTSSGLGNWGVNIFNGGFLTSGGGDVTVTGTGRGTGTLNYGVFVEASSQISAGGAGAVVVEGQGSVNGGDNSHGVFVGGANSLIFSNGGPVSVTGKGGGTGAGAGNHGISVRAGGRITAGLTGSVTVTGTAALTTGQSNFGIIVHDANSTITSNGGSVTIHGTGGGTGVSEDNEGVIVGGFGSVTAGGSGAVSVTGIGGPNAKAGHGVYVLFDGIITSAGGNVTVTGTGVPNGAGNFGVSIYDKGVITAGGSGTVLVSGTGVGGTNNHGVILHNSAGNPSKITSSGGAIEVVGATSFPGGYGIYLANTSSIHNGGALTVTVDSLDVEPTATIGGTGNNIEIRTRTAGRKIDLGGADSATALGLTDAELDRVQNGGLVRVGRNDATASGDITVSAAIDASNLALLTLLTGGSIGGSGFITEEFLMMHATGAISLSTPQKVDRLAAQSDTASITFVDSDQIETYSIDTLGGVFAPNGSITITTPRNILVTNTVLAGNSVTLLANTQTTPTTGLFTGILVNHTIQSGTGALTLHGVSGDSTSSSNQPGVEIRAALSTTGGAIAITGTSRGAGASPASNPGVVVANGAVVSPGGAGNLTVTGQGSQSAVYHANYGIRVVDANTKLTSAGGNVTLHGTGGAGIVHNHGIAVTNGARVTAGGAGTVSLTGTGGTGAGQGYGIEVDGADSTVTSAGGAVTLTGTSNAPAGTSFNYGVAITNSGSVSTTGPVTVTGTGAAANGNNYGIFLDGNASLGSTAANVLVTATGGGTLTSNTSNVGLWHQSGSIFAGGSGTLSITGTSGLGMSSGIGVYLPNTTANPTITTSTGEIIIVGNSLVPITGTNAGIYLMDGSVASTGNAAISFLSDIFALDYDVATVSSGTGPTTIRPLTPSRPINLVAGEFNGSLNLWDMELDKITAGTLTIGASNAGPITVSSTVTHGNNLRLLTGDNVGGTASITMAADKNLNVEAANTITVGGGVTWSTTGSGSVVLTTPRNVVVNGTVRTENSSLNVYANTQTVPTSGDFNGITVSGLLEVTGTGGLNVDGRGGSDALGQRGVRFNNNSVIRGGSLHPVTVFGRGGSNATDSGHGVDIETNALVTSLGAAVNVTGIGGGTTNGSYGVVHRSFSIVTAGGTGAVTIHGTGGPGSNAGVVILGGFTAPDSVTSSGGPVSITAVRTGTLINAIDMSSDARISSGGNAPITLIADTINLAGAVSSGTGQTTIRPHSVDRLLFLGGNDSSAALGLTDDELDRVTAGILQIGGATAGEVRVAADITRPSATHTTLTATNVTFTGGALHTGGGTLTLQASDDVLPDTTTSLDAAASTLLFTAGSTLKIAVNGPTHGSVNGHRQLTVNGQINLTGAGLELTGSYAPAFGNVFTIVSGSSRVGEFNGLPDNAILPFNGRHLRINYTPTGVTLTVLHGVASFAINGGAPQRSRVTSLTLVLDPPLDASLFTGTLTHTGGPSLDTASGLVLTPASGPASTLTITFADGNAGVEHGSLTDGRWQLSIPALNYTSPQFHRLFGDVNGDGTVDGPTDFAALGNVFGSTAAGSPFDFDANGTIDGPADFAQFGARFGLTA